MKGESIQEVQEAALAGFSFATFKADESAGMWGNSIINRTFFPCFFLFVISCLSSLTEEHMYLCFRKQTGSL